MSTEELTDKERANLLTCVTKSKLLRLYDAALVRAKAAEKETTRLARERLLPAESRLAEATALLWRVAPYVYADDASPALCTAVTAFLSAAPAQTAEPDVQTAVSPAAESEPDVMLRTVPYHDPDDLARIAALRAAIDAAVVELEEACIHGDRIGGVSSALSLLRKARDAG